MHLGSAEVPGALCGGAFREPPAVTYSYYVGPDFPVVNIGVSSTPHSTRFAAMSGFMSIF